MARRCSPLGLVTQLLDLTASPREVGRGAEAEAEGNVLASLARLQALGMGAIAEEVMLGDDDTISRFLALQAAARDHGLETFLRLRELTDEALAAMRQRAAQTAAKLAPGEAGPPGLQLMVDLGQPDEADLARWLPLPGRTPAESQTRDGSQQRSMADGPAGAWSRALAFSIFAPDAEAAIRRLDQVAARLLDAAERPGVEQPVWLAAFHVGEEGAASSPADLLQVAVHALALGIERIFLAPGPDSGWWPADLRALPPPLLAFRTLAARLDGAAWIARVAAGQYRIERPGEPACYLLWRDASIAAPPTDLRGALTITSPLGETRRVAAAQLKLTDEPVFVEAED